MSTWNSTHSKTPEKPEEANLWHNLEFQTKMFENIWLMIQEL